MKSCLPVRSTGCATRFSLRVYLFDTFRYHGFQYRSMSVCGKEHMLMYCS